MHHQARLGVWLLVLGACFQLHAQRKSSSLPEKYAKWIDQEVVYIISAEERKAFLSLESDDARDTFIREFWEVRNPLRGSSRNPFREEHYRRIEYANEHFGRETGTPGWMTDMGRTYITLGPPQSRAPFKGYSQMYPMELWFYANNTGNPSLPPFFNVLFFVPEDIGEYRFYHPVIDGPMKLVRGSQFNSNRDVYVFLKPLGGDLARAAFSLVPSEPLDTQNFSPSMMSEMLINKIQEFPNDSFELKRIRELRYLRERVKSWFLVSDQQSLDLAFIVLADPAGHYWLDYGMLLDDSKYGRPDQGGNLVVSAGFRLLNEKGELVVEDAEERAYPAFTGSGGEKKFQPFVLANRLAMVPGKYKLEVQIVNREAGRTYKAERTLTVGATGQAQIAGPVVASSVRQAPRPDPNVPFQYFGVQFQPSVNRRFTPREPVRALFQISVPPGQERNYTLEYVIANTQDRDMRRITEEPVAPQEFRNGTLLKSKTFSLEGLDTGDYRAVVNLKAEGSPAVLASANLPFRITDPEPQPGLFFLSNFQTASSTGIASYIRALEALSQQRNDEAAEYLRQSLEQTPSNTFAIRSLVELYYNSRKFGEITKLYGKLGMAALSTSPDTLAQIALSFWETGNSETAHRVLEVAQNHFPKNPVVIGAARKIGTGITP